MRELYIGNCAPNSVPDEQIFLIQTLSFAATNTLAGVAHSKCIAVVLSVVLRMFDILHGFTFDQGELGQSLQYMGCSL